MLETEAALFHGPHRPLEVTRLPLRPPEAGELLVRVTGCTLCGSDLHTLQGRRQVACPSILGHEILGRIETAAQAQPLPLDLQGEPLRIGDRIVWSIVQNCGQCFFCRRDLPQKCLHQTKYGHERLDLEAPKVQGGLAQHCLLSRGTAICRVPDTLADEVAAPASCATATVAAAMEQLGAVAGQRLLIMGAGMLGVTAAAWARAAGAEQVLVCDQSPLRLQLAEKFGATALCLPNQLTESVQRNTGGWGVDAALELTGSNQACASLIEQLRLGGQAVLVGAVFPGPPMPLLVEQVVRRMLRLSGLHNYAPRHLQQAISFLASHTELPLAELIAPWEPLSELNRLLGEPLSPGTLRLAIRP
jgi:putative phosphonate catabolism associated alcohol dehydrogenase